MNTSKMNDSEYINYLQEEISSIKSKMELDSHRYSNDNVKDAKMDDI